jgi:hypothetical protein
MTGKPLQVKDLLAGSAERIEETGFTGARHTTHDAKLEGVHEAWKQLKQAPSERLVASVE